MLSEATINQVMARVFRRRRRAWEHSGVLEAQPLQALQSRGQPDILITEPGRDPVVIETEVLPATTVEQDATSRLGSVTNTGDRIHAAIAVRLPSEWRQAVSESLLEQLIETGTLEWAIHRSNGSSTHRWPSSGWIRSPISVLAFAAYQSTLARHRVEQASVTLSNAVLAVGKKLGQMKGAGYKKSLRQIAKTLYQVENEQTWGMAGLILANAMAFHELLAGRGQLADVPTPSTLRRNRGGQLRKDDVLDAWGKILRADYWSIFVIARDVLELIPDTFADQVLDHLYSAVVCAGLRTLLPSHDVLSETFQRLITDRKKLASFYTLPATAELLAALSLTPDTGLGGRAWDDAEGLGSVVIADYACGTGTLLAAAYRRMCWLHESVGGDPEQMHPTWMANSLMGIDVLPAASHLTATILSGAHPMAQYSDSQVYIAPYGASGRGASVSLGSLDLLDTQLALDQFVNLATRVGSHEQTDADLKREAKQADLCIMNPPYTRNTNHEAERANDVLPAFAAFGIPGPVQKAMSRRMKQLTRSTFAHGNAGVSSAFLALADKMTKQGGILAMVMPLTLLTGFSWSKARKELAKRYRDFVLVTISGLRDRECGFSSDTDMAECLLVARKADPDRAKRAVMVSLDQRPSDPLSATLLAEQIAEQIAKEKSGNVAKLEDAPNGGIEVRIGADRMGTLLSVPLNWGPGWVGARIADFSLAQAAYHLVEEGLAWLPGVSKSDAVPVSVVAMSAVARLGPLDRDINGKEITRGHPRGPFDVVPVTPGEVPTYPVLWGHRAMSERTLEFEADCKGVARRDAAPQTLASVAGTASHLHINRDWRFNSQPLQAQWTPRPAIGGRAWPAVLVHPHAEGGPCDPNREKLQAIALLLWLNSTPGILLRWLWSNRQQSGRGMMTREVLSTLPVLDIRTLSDDQVQRSKSLFETLGQKPLLPVHQLPIDTTRSELDKGLLQGILGWPARWFDPYNALDLLRCKLSAEPSVHGHIGAARNGARGGRAVRAKIPGAAPTGFGKRRVRAHIAPAARRIRSPRQAR